MDCRSKNILRNKILWALQCFVLAGAGGLNLAKADGVSLPSAATTHAPDFPIDDSLGGPESLYTNVLLNLVRKWPPFSLPSDKDQSYRKELNPVYLICIDTPGNSFYVGVQQRMVVNAPLAQVEAVLDDMNHYQDIFPGYEDIHILSRDGNKIVTYWEQGIPLFFVPNVKYQVTYLVDKSSSQKKVYRYQLKESNRLKKNDGLIVIESGKGPAGPQTLYTEYDFFDADWGIVKTLSPGRIWKDSVEGIYLSDLAIKYRAENPKWDFKKVVEESRKTLQTFPVDSAIEQKVNIKKLIGN